MLAACSANSQTFNDKSFSQSVFLVKKSEKDLGNWSGIVSFILLSMKKTVEKGGRVGHAHDVGGHLFVKNSLTLHFP